MNQYFTEVRLYRRDGHYLTMGFRFLAPDLTTAVSTYNALEFGIRIASLDGLRALFEGLTTYARPGKLYHDFSEASAAGLSQDLLRLLTTDQHLETPLGGKTAAQVAQELATINKASEPAGLSKSKSPKQAHSPPQPQPQPAAATTPPPVPAATKPLVADMPLSPLFQDTNGKDK